MDQLWDSVYLDQGQKWQNQQKMINSMFAQILVNSVKTLEVSQPILHLRSMLEEM